MIGGDLSRAMGEALEVFIQLVDRRVVTRVGNRAIITSTRIEFSQRLIFWIACTRRIKRHIAKRQLSRCGML